MRRFSLALAIGVMLVLRLPVLPGLPGIVAAVLLLGLLAWQRATLRVFLCGFLTGCLLTLAVANREQERQLHASLSGSDVTLSGRVSSVPLQDARRLMFRFEVDTSGSDLPELFTPRYLRLSWYGPALPIHAGERWQLTVRLKAPHSLGNPGGFDYAGWLFQQRLHAVGYVRKSPAPVRLSAAEHGDVDAVRERLAEALAATPGANQQLALVQALTLGLSHGVSDATWQLLRDSGTAHLLAISGLHIGLIATWAYALGGFVWWLCPALRKRWSRQSVSLLPSVIAAGVYAALAGFNLPAQRALLMLLVVAFATVRRRTLSPASGLLLALLLVLLWDPLSMLSAGFWLSFGTVAALVYLYGGRMQGTSRVRQAVSIHMKLGLLLLPATAWFFQSGALVAPLANIIAVPVVGVFIVPLALLTLLLVVLWPAAAAHTLVLVQWSLQQLLHVLDMLMQYTAGSMTLALPSAGLLVCSLAGVLVLLAPRGIRLRWLCMPLLLPGILFNIQGSRIDGFELHVLDVGQGLAAVIFTDSHTLVYDTGGRLSQRNSMANSVILPFLRSRGRSSIDALIVSHPDSDHSAGVADIMRQFSGISLYASDSQPEALRDALPCVAGTSWQWDDTVFSFVHPASTDFGSDNDLSCVLLVHSGNSRVLLTGDIEAHSEALLAARIGKLPVTVITAPHHGSRTSSTIKFIEALQPEYVVFPAGNRNAFGFPHAEVQMRYKLNGVSGYITGRDGALSFRFNRQGLREPPTAYWRTQHRFWHRFSE